MLYRPISRRSVTVARGSTSCLTRSTWSQARQEGKSRSFGLAAGFIGVSALTLAATAVHASSAEQQQQQQGKKDSAAAMVLEPYTKASFLATTPDGLVVLGVGLRSKYWLSVYAYAISGEPFAVAALASRSNEDFCKEFITHQSRKRLELRFQRDITGEDLRSAFQESLGSRTQVAALWVFQDQFRGLKLSTGTSLAFQIQYDKLGQASVTSIFEGKVLGTVQSTEVVTALLDVYLGASPISADIKPSIAAQRKVA